MTTTNVPTAFAARTEERLDAGEPYCALGQHFTDGEETVDADGERVCRAHADAMLAEEEGRRSE